MPNSQRATLQRERNSLQISCAAPMMLMQATAAYSRQLSSADGQCALPGHSRTGRGPISPAMMASAPVADTSKIIVSGAIVELSSVFFHTDCQCMSVS